MAPDKPRYENENPKIDFYKDISRIRSSSRKDSDEMPLGKSSDQYNESELRLNRGRKDFKEELPKVHGTVLEVRVIRSLDTSSGINLGSEYVVTLLDDKGNVRTCRGFGEVPKTGTKHSYHPCFETYTEPFKIELRSDVYPPSFERNPESIRRSDPEPIRISVREPISISDFLSISRKSKLSSLDGLSYKSKDEEFYPTLAAKDQADEDWKKANLQLRGLDGKSYPTFEDVKEANRTWLDTINPLQSKLDEKIFNNILPLKKLSPLDPLKPPINPLGSKPRPKRDFLE